MVKQVADLTHAIKTNTAVVKTLRNVQPAGERKDFTRSTRLDLILSHVQSRVDPGLKENVNLEKDLEFTYKSYPYKGDYCTLYGVQYSTLWYGPRENLGIYLVVVHTQQPAFYDNAELHTYMGKLTVYDRQ